MRKVTIEVAHNLDSAGCMSVFRLVDDGDVISSEIVHVSSEKMDGKPKFQVIESKRTAYLNGDGQIFFLENLLEPQPLAEFIEEQVGIIRKGLEEGRWKEGED
jgi:hypothetical protein